MPSLSDSEFSALSQTFPTGPYRHYKGGLYEVLGLGREEATLDVVVIYKSCKNNTWWTRPIEVFTEKVDTVDGLRPRFEPVA
ncbi:DUF1653 domain-containing protein [Limnobacter sp.]|uniref:DUF1653 domain-containing protein n=1 Tax=Limnobacter sp. TaxID=2003368 RepID=UPI003515B64A